MKVNIKRESVRGYWLTDVGQRVTAWVPKGEYELGPIADINGVPTAVVYSGTIAWHIHGTVAARLEMGLPA